MSVWRSLELFHHLGMRMCWDYELSVSLTEPELPQQVVIALVASKGASPEKSLMVQSDSTTGAILHHHISTLKEGIQERMIIYY